jgi:tetratricopeptide (TPR) repeat protein
MREDAHRIDAKRLAVPEKARREMIRAEEAQISGDSDGARKHLERAIEMYPDYADALNNLGTHFHRAGDYQRSLDYFTRVTQIDPQFYAGWVNLGGSLLALGRLEPALNANLKAARIRPDDPLVNSQLGINYFYLRRYGEAKQHLGKVLSIDPSSANSPQLFLAQIAMAERSPHDAEQLPRAAPAFAARGQPAQDAREARREQPQRFRERPHASAMTAVS